MNRRVFGLLLASITLIAGCPGENGGSSNQAPRRDEWSLVIDQPFPVYDAEGLLVIGDITIGGTEVGENFANRGDVIVEYVPMEAGAERIQVHMRRFTMAASQDSAEIDFEALQIWAYDSGTTPQAPEQMDEEDNCRDPMRGLPWRTGCEVRVYYEGMNQLDRAGADLRVTLPSTWVGELNVITEDNAVDSDYHNRGNVCVSQVPGVADIQLGNGDAFVMLADAAVEIPECPAADFAACEMSGFDPTCPCLGGTNPFTFASTKVLSHDAAAANVTVDVPPSPFWSSVNLTNEGPNQMKSMAGGNNCAEEPGLCCQATIDPSVGAFIIDEIAVGTEVTRNPWRNKGSINYPGLPAVDGAGYNIQLTSKDCQAITATEDPEEFIGKGLGTEQETAEHGNLTVCSGCIRGRSCDDLLPGG
jgi:hypothetical protein